MVRQYFGYHSGDGDCGVRYSADNERDRATLTYTVSHEELLSGHFFIRIGIIGNMMASSTSNQPVCRYKILAPHEHLEN
jgi:hypothetical protein